MKKVMIAAALMLAAAAASAQCIPSSSGQCAGNYYVHSFPGGTPTEACAAAVQNGWIMGGPGTPVWVEQNWFPNPDGTYDAVCRTDFDSGVHGILKNDGFYMLWHEYLALPESQR